jgi:hypothetical protein
VSRFWLEAGLTIPSWADRSEAEETELETVLRPMPSRDLTVLWIFRADRSEAEERLDCS